ncbi:agmatine deiminase family protein [Roseateles sp. PN1]|uniref:agmatine deiminase family protein n=1 Tax=Roseateles sp. PN1 TaxID=3137372 RepID=UPI003139259D
MTPNSYAPKLCASRRQVLQMGAAGLGAGLLPTLPQSANAAAAFSVPDEARPQTRVWMGWPASSGIWGSSLLRKVQDDIARLARTIAKYEPVTLLASGTVNATNARTRIGPTNYPVTILSNIPVDDCWLRDTGPVFRINGAGGLDCIGLNFNGWGSKQAWSRDGYVAERIAAQLGLRITHADIVGEGGGVIYDGDGTLIANESCWVNSNRNPKLSRADIEAELLYLYGASKMIWCQGIKGQDITDDHIDATAQFVAPGSLVIHNPPEGDTSIWAQDARKVRSLLSAATDARGRRFNITLLNQPTKGRLKGPDALLTYINYLVVNQAVITVNFGDTITDSDTFAKLSALYPGRTVEMIKMDSLYTGGGGIHCVTQQQPVV